MRSVSNCVYLAMVGVVLSAYPNITYAQSNSEDSIHHVYQINRWIAGGISASAIASGLLTIPARAKPNFTDAELQSIQKSNVNGFDSWSLNLNPANIDRGETYSVILQIAMGAAPLALLADNRIRRDWADILLMGLEVNAFVVDIYAISPLGPFFQTRYRPIVYYGQLSYDERRNGNNKNSFYSGHEASATAASFFVAKVISDYHPELGNDKYWIYGAALIPPILMGYARLIALDHFPTDVLVGFSLGTICGLVIPEIHRIAAKDMDIGLYGVPGGAGLRMSWTPPASTISELHASASAKE